MLSHISSRAGRVDHEDDYFADLETRAVKKRDDAIASDGTRVVGQVPGYCSF